jgi:hypothetical protein
VASVDLPDQKLGTADAPGVGRRGRANGDLGRRQAELSDVHPSSPGYSRVGTPVTKPHEHRDEMSREPPAADQADARDTEVSDHPSPGAPLTDREHAKRRAEVAAKLADATEARQTTEYLHTIDGAHKIWATERVAQHDSIIQDLYAEAADVRCDGKAILAGGLPGAGKTTVLTTLAGIDQARYLTLNPDRVKEEMAARGMLPVIEGLSPMEASELAHEECSYITKQLALRAYADRKNVIWDITMSSTRSTEGRITEMRSAGYHDIEGVFVDIPVEVSIRRADARHREGHDDYLAGRGFGGRYISPGLIQAHADADYGSVNRATFENVKPALNRWRCFDNSVDGRAAVQTGEGHRHDLERIEEATWQAK